MIATGNARLFSGSRVYRGDSITYKPRYQGHHLRRLQGRPIIRVSSPARASPTPDFNHYHLTNASFTTSNRQKPSFHLKASTIEYRPNDEVVLKNVVVYVGDVPVSFTSHSSSSRSPDSRPTYQFEIGNSGQFGYFIDNTYNWVANDKMRGSVEFDVRQKRGYAGAASTSSISPP